MSNGSSKQVETQGLLETVEGLPRQMNGHPLTNTRPPRADKSTGPKGLTMICGRVGWECGSSPLVPGSLVSDRQPSRGLRDQVRDRKGRCAWMSVMHTVPTVQ